MRSVIFCVLALTLLPNLSHAQAPVFAVTPGESNVRFFVKSSVTIDGKFDKWNATLDFPSADVTSGVLHIQIDAATVDTGSGMKNNKLKSKEFFDVANYPTITFRSTKIVPTGPHTFEIDGKFTIRGNSRTETLKLTTPVQEAGEDTIRGVLEFDRKQYGMNKGIPFVKIEDQVRVTVNMKVEQVSGPRLVYKR